MSFTKVAPSGIGTEPGTSILIGDSLLHSTGIDLGHNTGIGVTIRKHGDATFTGIITASAFFGDGSGLEGVSSSGIGTPLSDDDTSQLNKIYYVNQELSIGSTVTVNHPDSAIASYTHYQDLVVTNDADFIVSDGDTFIPDVLGINTSSLPNPVSSATGGRIRAGTITNAGANGAPNFPNGLTGTAGTFTGNLNVGGVLTYEDVTNIDSVGVITGRSNINCTGGRFQRGTATVQDGDAIAGGININGTDMDASVIMSVFGNDNDFTRISGSKSRNASVGSHTIVQNNDVLLSLKGFGSDGTNFEEAAQIEMQVDGTPNNNVMPGRIVFKTTTTDGVAERLRIASDGVITAQKSATFGNTSDSFTAVQITSSTSGISELRFADTTANVGYVKYQHSSNDLIFATNSTEKINISSDGYLTKPQTPFFSVYGTSNNQTYNQGADITFENAIHNVGNHFKMTSGTGQYQRFIAPVAGVYIFTFGMFPNAASNCRISLTVNGGVQTNPYISGCFTAWGTGVSVPMGSQMLKLNANDYVTVQVQIGTLTNTYDGHTGFQGYLLG